MTHDPKLPLQPGAERGLVGSAAEVVATAAAVVSATPTAIKLVGQAKDKITHKEK
jgi:hypothetical protein